MYDALYSPNLGLCGFRCRVEECKRVVRTYRGIVMHCKRVHGLEAQMAFNGFLAPKEREGPEKEETHAETRG